MKQLIERLLTNCQEESKADEHFPTKVIAYLSELKTYIETKETQYITEDSTEDKFTFVNDKKLFIAGESFSNKSFIAIERKDDFDNRYVRCFDCAMYCRPYHCKPFCIKERGYNIPECRGCKRKDGKDVIFKKETD